MRKTLDFVDFYQVGKLNGFPLMESKINYNDFLRKALVILKSKRKKIYIKEDLRKAVQNVPSIIDLINHNALKDKTEVEMFCEDKEIFDKNLNDFYT